MTVLRKTPTFAWIFLAQTAHAGGIYETVASFADPATSTSTPLFTFDAATGELAGGWTSGDLLLEVADDSSPAGRHSFSNVRFSMTPPDLLGRYGGIDHFAGGALGFSSETNAPLLTIAFGDAWLFDPPDQGAMDFMSNTVTFSGPALGPLTPYDGMFGFSFGNIQSIPASDGGGFIASSLFIANGFVGPSPCTGVILICGTFLSAVRRERR